jgi:hypothetical protein
VIPHLSAPARESRALAGFGSFLPQKTKRVSNAVSDFGVIFREIFESKWCSRSELNRDRPIRNRQLYPFELRERRDVILTEDNESGEDDKQQEKVGLRAGVGPKVVAIKTETNRCCCPIPWRIFPPGSPEHKHGRCGIAHHFGRGAANEKLPNLRVAIGPHYQQVDAR